MEILYNDKYIIIVKKDAGIPVQNDKSNDISIIDMVEQIINTKAFVITRLDKPVEGLVLLAKSQDIANKLSEMMKQHKIIKTYMAVVNNKLEGNGKLEHYIFKNGNKNISKIVNKGNIGAKLAILNYKVIGHYNDLSLVEINLITGRHHQIRVQLSHIGYPLYGDTKYNPLFKHKRGVTPALLAQRLTFNHPITNKEIDIKLKPSGIFEKDWK